MSFFFFIFIIAIIISTLSLIKRELSYVCAIHTLAIIGSRDACLLACLLLTEWNFTATNRSNSNSNSKDSH